MSSVEIIDTKFLDYDIRSCYIESTQMFLVSDLIRQYNKINNTNKNFKDYLRTKDTKELLNAMNEEINEGFLGPENLPDLIFNNKNNNFDIPHIIKFIKLQKHSGVTIGYVVCEELLIQCLMWVNKKFAIKVSKFLKNLRSINNDRFNEILNSNEDQEKQIELMKDQINEYEQQIEHLKTRSTPDNMNYHFCVLHNIENNHVTTFISKKQYNPSDKKY